MGRIRARKGFDVLFHYARAGRIVAPTSARHVSALFFSFSQFGSGHFSPARRHPKVATRQRRVFAPRLDWTCRRALAVAHGSKSGPGCSVCARTLESPEPCVMWRTLSACRAHTRVGTCSCAHVRRGVAARQARVHTPRGLSSNSLCRRQGETLWHCCQLL